MRKLSLGLVAAVLAFAGDAAAQNTTGRVVTTCGTVPAAFVANRPGPFTVDVNGQMCVNVTVSASVTFPTIGAAVPATGIYNAVNVAGTLRGLSGLSTGALFPATVAVVDASGNQVTTFGGSSAAVGATGAAVPASADYVGINVGGTLTGWTGAVTQGTSPWIVAGGGTAGTAATGVVTIQGIASMTKLLVTPDANSAVNVAQINGVTPLMGNGVTGTGSQRVTIASDNTAFSVNATLGTETTKVIGTVRNVGSVGGAFDAATGAAPPANALQIGANASGATGGLLAGIIQCDQKAIYDASTNGSTELVALTSGRTIYICGKTFFAAGTVNVKLIYGTGTACATGSNNLTPAYQLTAQTGLVEAVSFYRGSKTASANALCINTSAGVAVQAEVYYSIL